MPATLGHTNSEPDRTPRRRWAIACLLGFGVLVNYFDRVNLSVSKDALTAAFGISAVTFGYLSSAYNWTYAALQLPSGLLLDKFGVRRVGRISTILWAVASFGAAVSMGIGGFLAARLLLGIGEAPTFPANSKAIGYWFPKQERSLATAIFDSMAKLSSAIGVPLLGILLLHFGWRWSFASTGFISIVFFILFYAFYRNPSEDKRLSEVERQFIAKGGAQPEDQARAAKGAPLWYLIRQRRVSGLALGFFGYNYTFYLLLTWLPSYFAEQRGLSLSSTGWFTGFGYWGFAIVSTAAGYWSDSLIRRGADSIRTRRWFIIAGLLMASTEMIGAAAPSNNVALFFAVFSLSGLGLATGNLWALTPAMLPGAPPARLAAVQNMAANVPGIVAPIVTGWLKQATGGYQAPMLANLFFIFLGIASYLILVRPKYAPGAHSATLSKDSF